MAAAALSSEGEAGLLVVEELLEEDGRMGAVCSAPASPAPPAT
jgi:hypothetical protein